MVRDNLDLHKDIQDHLEKISTLVNTKPAGSKRRRVYAPTGIPPPPAISIPGPSSCPLEKREKVTAAIRAARPDYLHPPAIFDPADPEWPEGVRRIK